MDESKRQKPVTRPLFVSRLLLHAAIALALIAVSMAIGMSGYVGLEHLTPLDALMGTFLIS